MTALFAAEVTFPVTVLGLIVGTTYGLLAMGLVLVYRSSRVINFAHGEIGVVGAAAFGVIVVRWHVPYYLALPIAVLIGAALGIVTEVAIVRRLRRTPVLVKVVATLGFAAFLQIFSVIINAQVAITARFPRPPWLPEFSLGPLFVGRNHTAMLLISPVVVVALAWFIRKSRYGTAIRGVAANPEAARLAGVSASRMSGLAWALAGALSAYTAVLLLPTAGFSGSASFGPGLLLRALAAAMIARMSNLSVAFAGGLGIGVIEQQVRFNSASTGPVNVALFGVILGALLLQRRRLAREEEGGSWLAVEPWPRLSRELLRIPTVRYLGWSIACAGTAIAVLLGIAATPSVTVSLIAIMAFAIIGFGLSLISGLAGQLSLGQFALAGIGAAAAFVVVDNVGNFFLGFAIAGMAGALVSVVLGLPAVRIKGLMFAVVTLAFAQAAPWFFEQSWMFGTGKDPGRPVVGSFEFDTTRRYYYLSLVVVLLCMLFVRNVWRGGLGRRYRAVRDNEDNARAFTVSATRAKLEAFAVAGFLTGIGGALYAHSLAAVGGTSFPLETSLTAVAIVAIGGIGVMAGPLIGALYIVGIPRFLPLDTAGLAATSLGWLLLLLYFPGGVPQLIAPVRRRLVELAIRVGGGVPSAAAPAGTSQFTGAPTGLAPARSPEPARPNGERPEAARLLTASGLVKTYGGLRAVDDVSLEVREGETLGLIGPNGAGKTTLFELLGGFNRADTGAVYFRGQDISSTSPEGRGRLGLIRSFQDATLFPTFTVLEVVALSLERTMPTRFLPSLLGLRSTERAREERASAIVEMMGLGSYADTQIAALSTGTRRITELAALVALEPALLLLDEPSSGIAQRETEALGEVIAGMKARLGITLVVIEHDMPLIMGLSDRIIAMEAGSIIASGSPEAVKSDPRVIEAYLGVDQRAIERSTQQAAAGTVDGLGSGQCSALTREGQQCSRPARTDGLCAQHHRLLVGAARDRSAREARS